MEKEVYIGNPGSAEAVKAGCLCPVMDNNHGKGFSDGKNARLFWYTSGCPVHKAQLGEKGK